MTPNERAEQFVNSYPLMFTEDKDYWIAMLALEISIAELDVAREFKKLVEDK